jgi:hypothetical protein
MNEIEIANEAVHASPILAGALSYAAYRKADGCQRRLDAIVIHLGVKKEVKKGRMPGAGAAMGVGLFVCIGSAFLGVSGCKTTTVEMEGVGKLHRQVPIIGNDDFRIRIATTNGMSVEAGSTTTGPADVIREARELVESVKPVP